MCDSSIVWMLDGPDGEPVNVSKKSPSIPASLRRSVRARDKTCRFPGCDQRQFIDLHHLEHRARGGKNTRTNLYALCWFHHRLVHEGGWTLQRDDNGDLHAFRPDGTELLPGEAVIDPACDVRRQNAAAGIAITPETAIPRWYGDPLDLGLAIDSLLSMRERQSTQEPPGTAAA
jgi:hypothetical protein